MYECYFCYFVSYSKCRQIFNRSSNSLQEYLEPIKLWKITLKNVCLYFHRLREVRVCSTKTLRSYRIQKSAHLVYFTWSLQYSISDWFSDSSLTSAKHSPFVDFLIEAAAVHGLLILIFRALFTLLRVHTCDVSGHMIKLEAFMADGSRRYI